MTHPYHLPRDPERDDPRLEGLEAALFGPEDDDPRVAGLAALLGPERSAPVVAARAPTSPRSPVAPPSTGMERGRTALRERYAPQGTAAMPRETVAPIVRGVGRGFQTGIHQVVEAGGEAIRMAGQALEQPQDLGLGLGVHRAQRLARGQLGDRPRQPTALTQWIERTGRRVSGAARARRDRVPVPTRLSEAQSPEEALEWAAFALGQGLASTIPSVGGAVIGGVTAGPPGAIAGAALPSYLLNQNEVRQSLIAEGVDEARADQISGVAAVPMAALDAALPLMMGTRLTTPVRQAIQKAVLRRVAFDALTEGGTEGAQNVISQGTVAATTGRPFDWWEIVEDALAGTLTGGALSVAGEGVQGVRRLAAGAEPDPASDPRLEGLAAELLGEAPPTVGDQPATQPTDAVMSEAEREGQTARTTPRRGIRRRLADMVDPSRQVELETARVELEEAFRDPMTGLPNQTAFERARARLDVDPAAHVASLDVTHLKPINDTPGFGRGVADERLAEVARILQEEAEARGIDPRDVQRAGGDEFAVWGSDPAILTEVIAAAKERLAPLQVGEFTSHLRGAVGRNWLEAEAAAQAEKKTETGPRARPSPSRGTAAVPETVEQEVPAPTAREVQPEPDLNALSPRDLIAYERQLAARREQESADPKAAAELKGQHTAVWNRIRSMAALDPDLAQAWADAGGERPGTRTSRDPLVRAAREEILRRIAADSPHPDEVEIFRSLSFEDLADFALREGFVTAADLQQSAPELAPPSEQRAPDDLPRERSPRARPESVVGRIRPARADQDLAATLQGAVEEATGLDAPAVRQEIRARIAENAPVGALVRLADGREATVVDERQVDWGDLTGEQVAALKDAAVEARAGLRPEAVVVQVEGEPVQFVHVDDVARVDAGEAAPVAEPDVEAVPTDDATARRERPPQADQSRRGPADPAADPSAEPQRLVAAAREAIRSGDRARLTQITESLQRHEGAYRYPVAAIRSDPPRFQFKQLGPSGVAETLKGVTEWNEMAEGTLAVMLDPQDGEVYVINGHHRLDLARRLQRDRINVMFIRADNAAQARAEGAIINMMDGNGTPTDVGKFLRDSGKTTEELRARGVSLRADLARKGIALSHLAPDIFDQVASGQIPETWGVALGEGGLAHAEQRAVLGHIRQTRFTEAEVREAVRRARAAGSEKVQQETLFGTETRDESLFIPVVRLTTAIRRRVAKDKRLFGPVTKGDRAAQLARAGTTQIDVEAAREIVEQSAQVAEVFDRLSTRSGPISDILTEGARRVLGGETVQSVADDVYPRIGDAVRDEVERSLRPGAGSRPQDAAGGPVDPETGEPGDRPARESTEEVDDDGRVRDSTDLDQNALFESAAPYRAVPPETKLRVTHSLTVENLVAADKLGAFPAPSMAVTTEGVDAPTSYGPITLIGKPSLGDPTQVDIYDADAYSGRNPLPEYPPVPWTKRKPLFDELSTLSKELDGDADAAQAINELGEGNVVAGIRRAVQSPAMMLAYLRTQGQEAKPVRRRRKVSTLSAMPALKAFFKAQGTHSTFSPRDVYHQRMSVAARTALDEFRAQVAQREGLTAKLASRLVEAERARLFDGQELDFRTAELFAEDAAKGQRLEVDHIDTRERFRELIKDPEAYAAWVQAKIEPLLGKPFLRVGGRKVPYTAENVVAGTKRGRAREVGLTFGPGAARAAGAQKFDSLVWLRNAATTPWGIKPRAEVDAARDATKDAQEAWRQALLDQQERAGFGDTWSALDNMHKALGRAMRKGLTHTTLRRELSKVGFRNLSPALLDQGVAVGKMPRAAPVPYFEAKPHRVVRFEEFAGALMPKDASPKVRAILEKHGIPVKTYGEVAERGEALDALATETNALFEKGSPYDVGDGEPDRVQQAADQTMEAGRLNDFHAEILGFTPAQQAEFNSLLREILGVPAQPMFARGDWVRVKRGSFEGRVGRVSRVLRQDKTEVALLLMDDGVGRFLDTNDLVATEPRARSRNVYHLRQKLAAQGYVVVPGTPPQTLVRREDGVRFSTQPLASESEVLLTELPGDVRRLFQRYIEAVTTLDGGISTGESSELRERPAPYIVREGLVQQDDMFGPPERKVEAAPSQQSDLFATEEAKRAAQRKLRPEEVARARREVESSPKGARPLDLLKNKVSSEYIRTTFGDDAKASEAAQMGYKADQVPGPDDRSAEGRRARLKTEPKSFVVVTGKRAASAEDIGAVFQPFRSPKTEKAGIFLLDDQMRITAATWESSGAIDYVALLDDPRWLQSLVRRARRVGSSKVVIAHNHPSGDPTPSLDDKRFTKRLARLLAQEGLTLERSYVIDHDTVAELHPSNPFRPVLHKVAPAPGDQDWLAHGVPLRDPAAVVAMMQAPPANRVDVVYRNTQGRIVAIAPHSLDAAYRPEEWLTAEAKGLGAVDAILVLDDRAPLRDILLRVKAYDGERGITDVIAINAETGVPTSAQEAGVYTPPKPHRTIRHAGRLRESRGEYGPDGAATPVPGAPQGPALPESVRVAALFRDQPKTTVDPALRATLQQHLTQAYGLANPKSLDNASDAALVRAALAKGVVGETQMAQLAKLLPPTGQEPTSPSEPERTVSLKKAEGAVIRARLGLDELPAPLRQSFQSVWDDAIAQKLAGDATLIAQDANARGIPLTAIEHAATVQRYLDLERDLMDARETLVTATRAGNDAMVRQQSIRSQHILEEIDILTKATDRAGTEAGRALAIRRLRANVDSYTLSTGLQLARTRKGSALTPEEVAKIEGLTQQVQTLETQNQTLTQENTRLIEERDQSVAAEVVKITTQQAKSRKADPVPRILVERQKILQDLKALGLRLNDITGVSAEGAYLLGRLAVSHIREAAATTGTKVELRQIVAQVLTELNNPSITARDIYQALNATDPRRKRKQRSAVERQVQELKTEAKLLTAIEDAERGVFAPKATTAERSAHLRALQKHLRDLRMRAYQTGLAPERLERAVATINSLQDQIANQFRVLRTRKGEVTPELHALQEAIQGLRREMHVADALADLREQLRTGEFTSPARKESAYTSPALERNQIALQKARRQWREAIERMQPPSLRRVTAEVVGFLRTVKATADMSGTLRQGFVLSVRRPVAASKAFVKSAQAFFSEHRADQIENAIRQHPNQLLRDKAGLHLTERGGKLSGREEYFASSYAERIPGFGAVVRASERSMSTTLNLLRVAAFDQFVAAYPNATLDELRAWANWTNVASGRGDLGVLTPAATELALVFFAPRFAVSRFQTPTALLKHWQQPRVRKEIAKDYAAVAGVGLTMLAMAAMAGLAVGLDPRDPDFGKIRIGNTRIDIWGGVQQPMRLLARIILNATDRLGLTGRHLTSAEKDVDPIELLGRFAAFKLAPSVTLPRELFTGKTAVGEESTALLALGRSVVPLVVEDVYDVFASGDTAIDIVLTGTMVGTGVFLGVGMQTYEDSEASVRRQARRQAFGGDRAGAISRMRAWNVKQHPDKRIHSLQVGDDVLTVVGGSSLSVLKPLRPDKPVQPLRP